MSLWQVFKSHDLEAKIGHVKTVFVLGDSIGDVVTVDETGSMIVVMRR